MSVSCSCLHYTVLALGFLVLLSGAGMYLRRAPWQVLTAGTSAVEHPTYCMIRSGSAVNSHHHTVLLFQSSLVVWLFRAVLLTFLVDGGSSGLSMLLRRNSTSERGVKIDPGRFWGGCVKSHCIVHGCG